MLLQTPHKVHKVFGASLLIGVKAFGLHSLRRINWSSTRWFCFLLLDVAIRTSSAICQGMANNNIVVANIWKISVFNKYEIVSDLPFLPYNRIRRIFGQIYVHQNVSKVANLSSVVIEVYYKNWFFKCFVSVYPHSICSC